MKQLSLILNFILLIAVGYLYYAHFSTKGSKGKRIASAVVSGTDTSGKGSTLIAYIELDSINEKVDYIRNMRDELEAEQRKIEKEWESGYRGLESQKNEFLKKGASITEDMAREFQGSLLQQQERIDGRKQEMVQKLSERSFKLMEDLQKNLKDYLAEFNSDKTYMYIFTTGGGLEYLAYKDAALDITDEVVAGLNEMLKDKKK